MDESELKIVETLGCVRCGTPAQVVQAEDLLRFTCPQDGAVHVLTVRAPTEVEVPEGEDPLVGRTMGPCRIVRRAGSEGGLPLYHGLDAALNQPHAVRVLVGAAARGREGLEAFVRAGRFAAAVRHRALATVTHLGKLEDGLFAISAPLEGVPFDQATAGGRRLAVVEALRFGRLLAEALALLHEKKIVHRNIGPKSVYLLEGGSPQLRNFTFAASAGAAADPRLVVGQPGYLAPEQARGEAIDVRADLYAFGALLYQALAGRAPFPGANPAEAIRAQLAGGPPERAPLINNAPPQVADLLMSLLAPSPADRPADTRAVLAILAAAEGAATPRPAPSAAAAFDEASLAIEESHAAQGPEPAPAAPPAEDKVLPLKGEPARREPGDGVEKPRAASVAALEFGPQRTPQTRPAGRAGGSAAAAPRPAPKEPAKETKPEPESAGALGDLVLDSEKEALSGKDELVALPDVEVPVPKPFWKRYPRLGKYGALAAVALAIALVAWELLRPAEPPPPTPISAGPKPATGPKARTPTPAEKAETEAKAISAKLDAETKAQFDRPDVTRKDFEEFLAKALKACDEILAKYPGTPAAARAKKARDIGVAAQAELRENDAKAKRPAAEGLLADASKPYADRLAAADAFVKAYAGTKAAEEMSKRREDTVKAAETAAGSELKAVKDRVEQSVAAKEYGAAITLLAPLESKHAGTQAGALVATQLGDLRKRVDTLLADKERLAEGLVRRYAFAEAIALFEEPLKVWKHPESEAAAKKAVANIRQRRADIVKSYGTFLEQFDDLTARMKFEEAQAAARAAVAKADDPALKTLLEGKAAEAELLLRALDRAVEGAKVEADKAAAEKAAGKGDGKVGVQKAGSSAGGLLPATVANPSRKGLKLDMPGLKEKDKDKETGEVGWTALAREQLIAFAGSAPGEASPTDRVALGLLALTGGEIKAAYGEFRAARQDAAARDLVLQCLRRNASGLVYIAAGEFASGANKEKKTLEGFLIGRHEVSQIEYAYFLQAVPGRETPKGWKKDGQPLRAEEEHPVVNVTWDDARAYADWLGMRLPTALEWERAARGTDGRTFPWGEKFERFAANVAVPQKNEKGAEVKVQPGLRRVTLGQVKGFALPLLHIVGNAREWTLTPTADPGPGKRASEYFALGGAADDTKEDAVKAFLDSNRAECKAAADTRAPFTGFRVVWPPSPPEAK